MALLATIVVVLVVALFCRGRRGKEVCVTIVRCRKARTKSRVVHYFKGEGCFMGSGAVHGRGARVTIRVCYERGSVRFVRGVQSVNKIRSIALVRCGKRCRNWGSRAVSNSIKF